MFFLVILQIIPEAQIIDQNITDFAALLFIESTEIFMLEGFSYTSDF